MIRRGVGIGTAIVLLMTGSIAWAAEIHEAVRAGDAARVSRLLASDPALARRASEDVSRDQPLHVAARHDRVEIARLLLAAGADLEGPDSDESTPLHVALAFRRPAMVRFLLEQGADVNRRDRNGGYALSFAVGARDTAGIRLVRQAGADLHYRSARGATLLHLACRAGMWDVAEEALLREGLMDVRDGAGATPLHHVAVLDDSARVARVIRMGAPLAATDTSGQTALTWALMRGARGAIRALVAAGADVRAPDRGGWAPLDFAIRNADGSLARLLLGLGADPRGPGLAPDTRLTMAIGTQDAGLVGLLLDHGLSLAPVDASRGRTGLQAASVLGRADVVETLLAHGAEVTARDAAGRTALDLARRYGHDQVARALLAHGAPAGAAPDAPPAGTGRVGRGEARVRYLGHSGWAVQTRRHLLVFDYCEDLGGTPPPDRPGLVNGRIVPEELRGERVTAFVSHAHPDHFDRRIFRWRDRLPGTRYVLGFAPDSAPPHLVMAPREVREIDGMRVTTIRANDSGVGYLVEVDGLVLFHAGDHANRHRDLSGDYTPEIEFLRGRGVRPDIAFLPISGCNFGDATAVAIGAEYTLGTLEPRMFLPMHGGFTDCGYDESARGCRERFPGVLTGRIENRGDQVRYRRPVRG